MHAPQHRRSLQHRHETRTFRHISHRSGPLRRRHSAGPAPLNAHLTAITEDLEREGHTIAPPAPVPGFVTTRRYSTGDAPLEKDLLAISKDLAGQGYLNLSCPPPVVVGMYRDISPPSDFVRHTAVQGPLRRRHSLEPLTGNPKGEALVPSPPGSTALREPSPPQQPPTRTRRIRRRLRDSNTAAADHAQGYLHCRHPPSELPYHRRAPLRL